MRRQGVWIGLVVVGLWLAVAPAHAQDAAKPTAAPEKVEPLTQAEQDQLTIALLSKDNAEKALRLAGLDYQRATEAADKAIQSLQRPGTVIQINAQTGKPERVKAPEPKKDPPK